MSSPQTRTWHQAHVDDRTTGQRVADRTARVLGSWPFIIGQTIVVVLWIVLNVTAVVRRWDPYPFILLNLMFSVQAAYAAPILMMSQNRQAERDRYQAQADFDTNVKAEYEIEDVQTHLHSIEATLERIESARLPGSATRLWEAFLASGSSEALAAVDATYTSWQFGYGVEQGDRLVSCVLDGPKRATTGALWAYEAEGETVPVPGDYSVILDGHGIARCVIRTTAVDVIPFDEVDAAFAHDEGEGDRSLEYWRDAHWAYFVRELADLGREATRDMPVVCERFEVVYRSATPPSCSETS